MRRLHCVILVILLGVGAAVARAQDEAPAAFANPTLLPRSILALRGEEQDRAQLRLTFDRTRDGKAAAPLTAWVGADYFAVIDGPRLTITDLRLRRRLIVDATAQTLVNLSLYGDVMFRRIELIRRVGIARQIAKGNAGAALPASLARFWIESELGIIGPEPLPASIEQRQDGVVARFLYRGQNVASVTPGDTTIPGNLRHSYRAFIRHTLPLHPRIAGWLAAQGSVPARLDYISQATGRTEAVFLVLRDAAIVAAGYPLPPRLTLVLLPTGTHDPDVALMREVLPQMVTATTVRGEEGPRQLATARTQVDQALQQGRPFDAALRLTELALRWGRGATDCGQGREAGPCPTTARIDRILGGDKRSRAMFEATAVEERDPDKAIAIWRGLDRTDVPSGYVIDIFLARLLSERGYRNAAAESFAAAFAGDPYIPTLYRDLGDYFARASRLDLAWLCYDLGRALPNRTTPDALTGVDTIERELADAYPDLF